MALRKGARKLYEWLREQSAGSVVGYEEVMNVAGWSEVSLKTYITKDKIPSPQAVGASAYNLPALRSGVAEMIG